MQSVEPVLENAIKTLQKVVDVRGMGKKLLQLDAQEVNLIQKDDEEECWSGKGSYLRPGGMKKEEFEQKKKCKDPCDSVKRKEKEAEEKAEEAHAKEKQMEAIEAKEKAMDIVHKQEEEEEKATKAAIENDPALKAEIEAAQASEARGDADAAVAKTAAIKNIQKALTARILKRLDDGQPLVEVARKMKAIEGMQPQINDMERRLGIMQSVEPVLENAIKTLQKVVDVRGMGKK